MHKDSIGREIKVGDVCVHIHRSSSSMYFEPLIVRELLPDSEVRGAKVVEEFKQVQGVYGYYTVIRPSKKIRSDRVIVTGLTESQLLDMKNPLILG